MCKDERIINRYSVYDADERLGTPGGGRCFTTDVTN